MFKNSEKIYFDIQTLRTHLTIMIQPILPESVCGYYFIIVGVQICNRMKKNKTSNFQDTGCPCQLELVPKIPHKKRSTGRSNQLQFSTRLDEKGEICKILHISCNSSQPIQPVSDGSVRKSTQQFDSGPFLSFFFKTWIFIFFQC